MKKYNSTVIILFLAFTITIFLFLVNDIVISIRLSELQADLREQDRRESNMDHIGLVATYQINKDIYEKKITQESADATEVKVMSLINSMKRDYHAINTTRYKIIEHPALAVINFNRGIIGKAPLSYHQSSDQSMVDLDIAYYYERNFLYSRAIALYEIVLKVTNTDSALKASLLLHQGYCYALAGMHDKAKNNYSTIINKYGNENSAITAAILLRYLEGFKLARERVLSSDADPLLRSQDLVNLLAYELALKILEEEELKASPIDIPRIKYFKARCLNSLGKPEKAIENYLEVITSSPASKYAMYSNRKLFIIGSRAGGENKIIELSKHLNNKLKDPVMSEMIKNRIDNPEPADYTKKIENINLLTNLMVQVDKIMEEKKSDAKKAAYLVITTSDGNTFKGSFIEQNEKEISLQTSIGRINIKKDKVTSTTKIE